MIDQIVAAAAGEEQLRSCMLMEVHWEEDAGVSMQGGLSRSNLWMVLRWYENGMTTTIDSAGRIVVPKALREQAGLLPNTELEIRMVDGALLLEPKPIPMRIEQRDGIAVLVAPAGTPKMTAAQVEAVREEMREDRSGNAGGRKG